MDADERWSAARRDSVGRMAVSRPTKSDAAVRAPRTRMTAPQRRAQLIEVARGLFAERGFEGTSIEEIAQRASVSKPIVYEHFGGKEGLYAVVVDREMETLLEMVTASLSRNSSLHRIQSVALALLTYMEERTDGFRILMRGESTSTGGFSSLLNDAISQVEHILAGEFDRRGFDPALAPMYAQALVGMVSVTAQWWLDVREPSKEVVAAHLVNLCWNGLARLNPNPRLISTDASGKRSSDTVADD